MTRSNDPVASDQDSESRVIADSSAEDSVLAGAIDQDALERGVALQAERQIIEQGNEDDRRRLDKAQREKQIAEHMLATARAKQSKATIVSERRDLADHVEKLEERIAGHSSDVREIKERMRRRIEEAAALERKQAADVDSRLPHESDRDFLLRTGKITPFNMIPGLARQTTATMHGQDGSHSKSITALNLRTPGFTVEEASGETSESGLAEESADSDTRDRAWGSRKRKGSVSSSASYTPESSEPRRKRRLVRKGAVETSESESEGLGTTSDEYCVGVEVARKPKKSIKRAKQTSDNTRLDDGDEKLYQTRLKEWSTGRSKAREKAGRHIEDDDELNLAEWHMPHPTEPDEAFAGGFKVPGDIWPSLFDYQKVGVQWLWELHCQSTGGILGDEMGLGKTVQVISLIAGLHYSGMLDKPTLIVAPGALLKQWASEFHVWWPAIRVAILHQSGSGMLVSSRNDQEDEEVGQSGAETDDSYALNPAWKASKASMAAAKQIVNRVFKHGHVLVTTYEGLTTYRDVLLHREWSYAILDEGHKIRNPDTKVSLACKQLKTHHRLILSGTPIQNNLTELWSLFDFVFPTRLGTLPDFREQFEVPIRVGGYRNADNTAVQTASACATVLREMIGPYLLRRLKVNVLKDLPKKDEKVLFCKLTEYQRAVYKGYIEGSEVKRILAGDLQPLAGIAVLRKICNHPDLIDRELVEQKPDYKFGDEEKSGKMLVTKKMLELWKKEGHRVLLFSQSVQVLNLLEGEIKNKLGYKYRRMDGSTPIPLRQGLVNEFNRDATIDVFLMTTRVGGLGLNLTGADRVVIWDPDWNPSTDVQARERAWRIGQKKPVSILRLVTAGTIEEKMYNRQLFKQHLSQKVLSNAAQRRIFETETVKELFTLGSIQGGSSIGAMFRDAETVYPQSGPGTPNEGADLQRLSGVTSLVDYKPEHELESDEVASKEKKAGEKQFIEEIFSASGVISSLEHDRVAEPASRPRRLSVGASYAESVARDARKKLEESVKRTQGGTIGTVTWTGRSGTAGAPQRASASSILANLKKINEGRVPGTGARSLRKTPDLRPLPVQIMDLFRKKGGRLTTQDIKEWCSEQGIDQRNPDRAQEMRQELKKVALLDKERHEWRLKR